MSQSGHLQLESRLQTIAPLAAAGKSSSGGRSAKAVPAEFFVAPAPVIMIVGVEAFSFSPPFWSSWGGC